MPLAIMNSKKLLMHSHETHFRNKLKNIYLNAVSWVAWIFGFWMGYSWSFVISSFQVSEEYKLVPDTLYLTVNLIDRFLSQSLIQKQGLQLLGVTCMLIAS